MYCFRFTKWLILLLLLLLSFILYLLSINNDNITKNGNDKSSITKSLKGLSRRKRVDNEIDDADQEKFITYLPHSGLHNQRIALINAMLVAKALDRTLLMPEINLGHAIYWRPASTLSRQLDICPRLQKKLRNNKKKKRAFKSLQCDTFKNYVPIPVDAIFDISVAQKLGIRTEQRLDMKRDYIKRHNKLFINDKNNKKKTKQDYRYRIPDTERYSYRLHDSPITPEESSQFSEDRDNAKFTSHIDLQSLRHRPERYIEFGSLFSMARLSLNQPELIWAREHLHREIGTRHPLVKSQAQKVISKLGGKGKFVSVHLRQGDGFFKKYLHETVKEIETKLTLQLKSTEQQQQQQHRLYERQKDNSAMANDVLSSIANTKNISAKIEKCVLAQDKHIPGLDMIFLATDASKPRITLKTLFRQYPCTFTLGDFSDININNNNNNHHHRNHHNHNHNNNRKKHKNKNKNKNNKSNSRRKGEPSQTNILQNASERVKLGRLLYPMMDAEIASHASLFIGTPKSTYSSYVNYRNQHNRILNFFT